MKNWRIKKSIVVASMFCVLAGATAWAEQGALPEELENIKRMVQEVISENQELKIRLRELEAAMTKQGQATKETAQEAVKEAAQEAVQELAKEATQAPPKEAKGLLGKKIDLGGAIEVEARQSKNFARVSESHFNLSTAEFDFEAKLRDWAKASLAVSWDSAADKFTVDEALITLGNPEKFPLSLKAGRGVVPFGLSTGSTVAARLEDKLTVTDPLTLAVFDTKEDHVLLGVTTGGFHASAYVFNGQTNRRARGKHLEHYGAAVGYDMEIGAMSLAAGISLIDSVVDSDGLTEAFPEALTSRYVPGIAAHVRVGFRGFSLVAAYYEALRDIEFTREDKDIRIQPDAWHIEVGYTTWIFSKKTFFALSHSQTHELAGAFPERREIATVGTWLFDGLRLAFDYAYDQDYARAVGGTGRSADAFTLRLTYEW